MIDDVQWFVGIDWANAEEHVRFFTEFQYMLSCVHFGEKSLGSKMSGFHGSGLPLPIGVDHCRRHVARIAQRRCSAWSGVSVTPAAGPAVSHGVIRAGAGCPPRDIERGLLERH
jgi:hypothetical protein